MLRTLVQVVLTWFLVSAVFAVAVGRAIGRSMSAVPVRHDRATPWR